MLSLGLFRNSFLPDLSAKVNGKTVTFWNVEWTSIRMQANGSVVRQRTDNQWEDETPAVMREK